MSISTEDIILQINSWKELTALNSLAQQADYNNLTDEEYRQRLANKFIEKGLNLSALSEQLRLYHLNQHSVRRAYTRVLNNRCVLNKKTAIRGGQANISYDRVLQRQKLLYASRDGEMNRNGTEERKAQNDNINDNVPNNSDAGPITIKPKPSYIIRRRRKRRYSKGPMIARKKARENVSVSSSLAVQMNDSTHSLSADNQLDENPYNNDAINNNPSNVHNNDNHQLVSETSSSSSSSSPVICNAPDFSMEEARSDRHIEEQEGQQEEEEEEKQVLYSIEEGKEEKAEEDAIQILSLASPRSSSSFPSASSSSSPFSSAASLSVVSFSVDIGAEDSSIRAAEAKQPCDRCVDSLPQHQLAATEMFVAQMKELTSSVNEMVKTLREQMQILTSLNQNIAKITTSQQQQQPQSHHGLSQVESHTVVHNDNNGHDSDDDIIDELLNTASSRNHNKTGSSYIEAIQLYAKRKRGMKS